MPNESILDVVDVGTQLGEECFSVNRVGLVERESIDFVVFVPLPIQSGFTSHWATGHRNRSKLSIMQTKRRKSPHYKGGTKIRPYQ